VIGRILYWRGCQRLKAIARQGEEPEGVQRDVLLRLVRRAQGTRFGDEHGFAAIHTPEEFRELVPLQDYGSLMPYFERARDGSADETWPGTPECFAMTSGTTGGNKYLPHTRSSLRSSLDSAGDAMAAYLSRAGDRHLLSARVAFIGGSPVLGHFPSGMAWGDNTGILEAHAPAWMRAFRAPSSEVLALPSWEEKLAAAAKELARTDVRVLVGLPSWTLLLLDAVEEESGASIRDVWPSWRGFLHGGVAFDPYAQTYRRRAGEGIVFVDCYAAIKGGVLAVQDRDDDSSLALVLDRNVYYEFVPLDDPEGPRLGVHEVETGRPYLICVSTGAGLWAYRIGDVVRFTSTRPPRVVIEGRRDFFLNAFGEHVSQAEIERAVADATTESEAEVHEFTVLPEYPDARASRGRHAWIIEFLVPPIDLRAFARSIDASLQRGNDDYRAHRAGDRQLMQPAVRLVPRGTFAAWMARRGRHLAQPKVPRVIDAEEAVSLLGEGPRPASPPRPVPR